MQPLPKETEKRIEWMELMMEFIPDLYGKIVEKKKERQESYLAILRHIRQSNPEKATKQDQHVHYSAALKEAKKYIIADRKWIALKEIDKQCQEIENHESFHNKPKTVDKSKRAPVATVIFAFHYCKTELSGVSRLKEVSDRLGGLLGGYFRDSGKVIEAEKGNMLAVTAENENEKEKKKKKKLQRGTKVTREEEEYIVKEIARENHLL